MSFVATWVDVAIIILSEVNQTEKDKYHMISFTCGKKIIKMNFFTNRNQTHRLRKQTYGYQRGKFGERDKLGGWD